MERAIAIDAADEASVEAPRATGAGDGDARAAAASRAAGGEGGEGGAGSAAAPRLAGSDAERRAMVAWAARLGDAAQAQAVEALWLRPRSDLVLALHAGLGVVASVLAVAAPPVALGLAAATLLSLLLDVAGLPLSLRRLTPERASQNVLARIAAPPRDDALTLIVTAHLDTPRGGLLGRLARGRRPARRWLPGPLAWVVLALLAVAACAAVRLADHDGSALGAIQLAPTLVLVVALGLAVDAALARPAPPRDGDASGASAAASGASAAASGAGANAAASGANAAASGAGSAPGASVAAEALLSVAHGIAAARPGRIGVDVVLAGAGASGGLGFRAHLRRRRPDRGRVAVVELSDGAAPAWLLSDGPLLPLRYHPQLVALAAQAAAEEPDVAARPTRGRALGGALRARQRRLPAIRLVAPSASALTALALAFAELLDESRG